MEEFEEEPWADGETLHALEVASRHGMPPRAAGVFARWWQLETWLRDLMYVELRAKHGRDWESVVARATGRQLQDAAFTHMQSPDSSNPLAYLDYSQLIEIIASTWEIFGNTLVERRSWDGRQDDLKRIRHRIGHMRVPHGDDLARLEQTLRDLERGAFIALASYNKRFTPMDSKSPVNEGWLEGKHPTARRLLEHADRQYETRLHLQVSRRPWQSPQPVGEPAPGFLWHADFFMRGRTSDLAGLWRDSHLTPVKPLLVHLAADSPWHVGFTFSGADEGDSIADAIGQAFDAVLSTSRRDASDGRGNELRGRAGRRLDFRILRETAWNIVSEDTVPISNFGAGGGVFEVPDW